MTFPGPKMPKISHSSERYSTRHMAEDTKAPHTLLTVSFRIILKILADRPENVHVYYNGLGQPEVPDGTITCGNQFRSVSFKPSPHQGRQQPTQLHRHQGLHLARHHRTHLQEYPRHYRRPPFLPSWIPSASTTWYLPFRSLASIPILFCPSFHQSSPPTFLPRSNIKSANTWST